MTTTEEICRWEIVLAFWEWQLVSTHHSRLRMSLYARALGIDLVGQRLMASTEEEKP